MQVACRRWIAAGRTSAPLCDHCLVSELLLAALMAVTGVLNHNTTATCAEVGISLSTKGHPRRSKIPLDFGVSCGPHTFHHGIEICQPQHGRCARWWFRIKFLLEDHHASPCLPGSTTSFGGPTLSRHLRIEADTASVQMPLDRTSHYSYSYH